MTDAGATAPDRCPGAHRGRFGHLFRRTRALSAELPLWRPVNPVDHPRTRPEVLSRPHMRRAARCSRPVGHSDRDVCWQRRTTLTQTDPCRRPAAAGRWRG